MEHCILTLFKNEQCKKLKNEFTNLDSELSSIRLIFGSHHSIYLAKYIKKRNEILFVSSLIYKTLNL